MEVRGATVALVIDDAGALYPVRVDPLVWVQVAELTAGDGAEDDDSSQSVAIDGDTAIVGLPGENIGANPSQGAAYIFVRRGTTWIQQAELTASDGEQTDVFGYSVAVSGNTALVGALYHTVGADPGEGAAYVFVRDGTTWTQQAELTASDGAELGQCGFGSTVALSGGTALVGAPGRGCYPDAPARGAAYVFVQSGASWTQQAEFTASESAPGDGFAAAVAVSGDTAIVGAETPISDYYWLFVGNGWWRFGPGKSRPKPPCTDLGTLAAASGSIATRSESSDRAKAGRLGRKPWRRGRSWPDFENRPTRKGTRSPMVTAR